MCSMRLLLRGSDIPQLLPDFDLLARGNEEVKVVGCFKDEDDRAAEAETAHLLTLNEGLAIEDRGRRGVNGLGEGSNGMAST